MADVKNKTKQQKQIFNTVVSNVFPPRFVTSSTQLRLIQTSLWTHALLNKPKR